MNIEQGTTHVGHKVISRRQCLALLTGLVATGVELAWDITYRGPITRYLFEPFYRYCADIINYYRVCTNVIPSHVLADGLDSTSPALGGVDIPKSMRSFAGQMHEAVEEQLRRSVPETITSEASLQTLFQDTNWIVRSERVLDGDIEARARTWIAANDMPFINVQDIDASTVDLDRRNRTGFPYVFLGLESNAFSTLADSNLRSAVVRLYLKMIFGREEGYQPSEVEIQIARNITNAFRLITGLRQESDIERFIQEIATGEMATIRLGDINHVIEQLIMQYRNGEKIDVSAIQLDDVNPALANPFLRTWAAVDNATNHVYPVAIMVAGAETSLFRRNPVLNSLVYNMNETAQVIAYKDAGGNLVIYVMREPCGLNPTGGVVRKVEDTPTPSATSTPTHTPSPSATATETPPHTLTPSSTPTKTPTATASPTKTPTLPPTVTQQPTKEPSPSPTPTEGFQTVTPQPTKEGTPVPSSTSNPTIRPTVPSDPTSTHPPAATETPRPDPTNTSEPPATPTSERERPHPRGTPVPQGQSSILLRFLERRSRVISRGEGGQSFPQFLVMCAETWGIPVNKVRLLLATVQVLIKTLIS